MYKFIEDPIKIVAHRGDSMFYPENSKAAFESAISLGVDVIETDVHISRDGIIFIWHDDDTKRLDGSNKDITSRYWEEIKDLDMGVFFKDKDGKKPFIGKGLTLMKFEDAIDLFPNTRFNVDLKDKSSDLVNGFYRILEAKKAFDRVLVASFHSSNIRKIRKISKKVTTSFSKNEIRLWVFLSMVRLSWLIPIFNRKIAPVMQAPEFSGSLRVISPYIIKALHRAGVKVQVWTINEREDMKRLLEMGVDGVMTDDPRTLIEVVKELDGQM